ncbi:MAG: hypothetical protein ACOC38_06830 [Promethearchaeia archaeon]
MFADKEAVWAHKGIPDFIDFFKSYTDYIIFTHLGKWLLDDVEAGREKMKQLSDMVSNLLTMV